MEFSLCCKYPGKLGKNILLFLLLIFCTVRSCGCIYIIIDSFTNNAADLREFKLFMSHIHLADPSMIWCSRSLLD